MIIATALFYIFAAVTVLSAVMVVSSKNPVHSVLFLILAFFNAAALFLLLGAELVAMLLIIVYVGAVAILFLFVVMMLDINFVKLREGFIKYLPLGLLVAVLMFTELFVVLNSSTIILDSSAAEIVAPQIAIDEDVTNAEEIGSVLYTQYAYVFQLAGLILLVAMIGAIVLTLRHKEGTRKQDITKQIARNPQSSIEIVKVKPGDGA